MPCLGLRATWFISAYKLKSQLAFYLLKVNNRNPRKRCEICSKLTAKTPKRCQWRRSGFFIVNFEHIPHLDMYISSHFSGKCRIFFYFQLHPAAFTPAYLIFFTRSFIYVSLIKRENPVAPLDTKPMFSQTLPKVLVNPMFLEIAKQVIAT